jgi:hypothetical protein
LLAWSVKAASSGSLFQVPRIPPCVDMESTMGFVQSFGFAFIVAIRQQSIVL